MSAVFVAALVVTLGHDEIARALDLFPDTLPANPRLILDHAWLLYVVVPITVVAAIVIMLAPGALVVAIEGDTATTPVLLLKAFFASFAVRFAVHAAWKLAGGEITLATFAGLDAVTLATLAGFAWMRLSRPHAAAVTWLSALESRRLMGLLAVPYLFVVAFLPEIFWKDLIGDGFETLYSGATLSTHIVTRFATPSTFYGTGLGMLSQAYPLSWFGTLFGFSEPAARLPVALYALLITAAVAALAEWQAARRLSAGELATAALAVVAFLATLGFASSYNSYAADFAAPLGVEALTVLAILAVIYMLWSAQPWWLLLCAVVGAFNRPNMLIVLAGLAVATALVRHCGWRRTLLLIGGTTVVCLGLAAYYEKVYLAGVAIGEVEGLNQSVFSRLRYLSLTDLRRVLFVVVPTGIVPAFAVLAFRRQDAHARVLALLALIYFAPFYVEAYYSLHHFAPVMVLPLVVFWRVLAAAPVNRRLVAAAAVGAVAALAVVFPWGQPIPRQTQMLARSIELDVPPLDPVRVGDQDQREHWSVLAQAFPPEWQVDDTSQRWAFDVASLAYYTHKVAARHLGTTPPLYRIQARNAPAPAGWTQKATTPALAGYVRDPAALQQQLDRVPSIDFTGPLYRIPRVRLLKARGVPVPMHDVDLRAVVDSVWRWTGLPAGPG